MSKATWDRYRQAEIRRTLEYVALAVAIALFVFVIAFVLSGCATDQPPCPDCWLALPKTQPARL
jgi:hypothetical protein